MKTNNKNFKIMKEREFEKTLMKSWRGFKMTKRFIYQSRFTQEWKRNHLFRSKGVLKLKKSRSPVRKMI